MTMASFNVTGTSAACATTSWLKRYTYAYAEGSIVYSVQKAQRGIMEAIAIKYVRILENKKTFFKVVPIYVDTLNSLWNENMLCTEQEAQQMAIAYLQAEEQKYFNKILTCQQPSSSS